MAITVLRIMCYSVERTTNFIPTEGLKKALESVKNHTSHTRVPPSPREPFRVSEAEYWQAYYEHPECQYEWNKGLLEEKPMPDFLSISFYQWFFRLLEEYLTVFPIGRMMVLEMGFRLELGDNEVSIRKPDLAVILHSNPVEAKPLDRSFQGVCDLCIEFLSDSTPVEVKRDTVHKKEEYAKGGVPEYYILDRVGKHTCFYRLHEAGTYQRLDLAEEGLIQSTVLDRFSFRRQDLEAQTPFKTLMNDPLYQPYLLKSLQEERQQKEQALKREKQERQQKEQERQQKEQALKREEQERQQRNKPSKRSNIYAPCFKINTLILNSIVGIGMKRTERMTRTLNSNKVGVQ